MKLAILNLTGGGISGGYKNYLHNILPRLTADPAIKSVLCISPRSLGVEELVPKTDKIRFAECPPFRPFSFGLDGAVESALADFGPDVIFVPTARPARFRDVPVVTMIQNMAPLVSWEWYDLWQRLKLLVQLEETYRAVRSSDKVIAISGFVKQFLVEKWGVSDGKIASVYFGVPLHPAKAMKPAQLPGGWVDFVFTAGSIEPYRSFEDIVKCAEHSRKSLGRPVRIMVAGSPRTGMDRYGAHLRRMAEEAGVSEDICWAGQLSHEEMTWCYRNCSAFVMTSRVEACPNTVLEAMACGAVCIAADNPPLPEFFEAAAVYYPPGDGPALAARIQEAVSLDGPARAGRKAVSEARAAKFTWEAATERTLKLFFEVSGRNKYDQNA